MEVHPQDVIFYTIEEDEYPFDIIKAKHYWVDFQRRENANL